MRITNINFVFHQRHPYEQERGGKRPKNGDTLKLNFSTILISIHTKHNMRITNITLVFDNNLLFFLFQLNYA